MQPFLLGLSIDDFCLLSHFVKLNVMQARSTQLNFIINIAV